MYAHKLDSADSPSTDLPPFPKAGPVPTALPEILRHWRLKIQLQHERCLNQLSWRFNQQMIRFLETEPGAAGSDQHHQNYQGTLFQLLVSEVSQGLMGAAVALAVPTATTPDRTTQFAIRYTAPEPRPLDSSSSSEASWGQLCKFKPADTLTQAELCALQTESPESVWPIHDGEELQGWLLIQSTVSSPRNNRLSSVLQSLNAQLIDRAVQHCVIALRQLKRLQVREQQQQELVTRNQELVQTNRLKSEFLANTSHEIRTPLSSILGFTHLLREQGYGAANLRHQEYLQIILSSGQHLLALINDILDLSKIEANQLTLQWESVEVRSVCQMALTLVREKAADKGLELHLEIAPEITMLVADSLRLKQMLFNLLSNGLKFTLKGAVGLKVTQAAGEIQFTVWDTGVGISAEQQSLLFRPYSQLANAATRSEEGTGLGLALTQKLAELHGGRIEVDSEPDRGSRFSIVLPLQPGSVANSDVHPSVHPETNPDIHSAAATPSPRVAVTETSRGISAPSHPAVFRSRSPLPSRSTQRHVCIHPAGSLLQNPFPPICARPNHLMLVEDNPHNAKLLLTYLSKLGYELTWVQTGSEMWQTLKRCLPALILMDIHLPSVDGLTLIQQLQVSSEYRHIPVIAQTAMAMAGDREICLKAGAVDYVSKPIDLTRLSRLIQQYTAKG